MSNTAYQPYGPGFQLTHVPEWDTWKEHYDPSTYPTDAGCITVTYADGTTSSVDYSQKGVKSSDIRKVYKTKIAATDPQPKPTRTRKAQPAMPRARIAQDEPMPPPTALPSLASQAASWCVTEGLQDRIAYQDDRCIVLRFGRLPGKTVKAQIKAQGFRWVTTLTWGFGPLSAIPAEYVSTERKVA